MKSFASLIPAMGLIAAAQAWGNGTVKPTHMPHVPHGNNTWPIPGNNTHLPPPVWVTTTVSEFTTYCPAPTVFPVSVIIFASPVF